MKSRNRDDLLASISDEQWGYVTTAQAETVGITRVEMTRLAQRGRLDRIVHGVYRNRGSGADELEDLKAAWLSLDPGELAERRVMSVDPVVVSHTSAARIHRLGDLAADESEFTVARRLQTQRAAIRVHRAALSPADYELIDGLPVTTPLRTITDLVADGHDGEHVAAVTIDAVRRRAVSLGDLAETLAPFAARRGHRRMDGAALLDEFLRFGEMDRESLERELRDTAWARSLIAVGALAGVQAAASEFAKGFGDFSIPDPSLRQNNPLAERAWAQVLDSISSPTFKVPSVPMTDLMRAADLMGWLGQISAAREPA